MPRRGASKTRGRAVMAPSMVPLACGGWPSRRPTSPGRRPCSTPSGSGPGRVRGRRTPLRPRAARARRPAQRRRPVPLLDASRRSSPTSTRAGTPSTWPSRTGGTTSTSAPSSAPRTPSSPRRCTSSGKKRWNRRGRHGHRPLPARPAPRRRRRPRRLGARRGPAVLAVDNLPGRRAAGDAPPPARLRAAVRPGGPRPVRGGPGGGRRVLSIAQYGSTRSINAGVAAGIAMHAWIRQHAGSCRPTTRAACPRRAPGHDSRRRPTAACEGQQARSTRSTAMKPTASGSS